LLIIRLLLNNHGIDATTVMFALQIARMIAELTSDIQKQ